VQWQSIWASTTERIKTLFLLIKQNASSLLIKAHLTSDLTFGWLGRSGPFYLLFAWARLGDFVFHRWLPSNPSVNTEQMRWQKVLTWCIFVTWMLPAVSMLCALSVLGVFMWGKWLLQALSNNFCVVDHPSSLCLLVHISSRLFFFFLGFCMGPSFLFYWKDW